MQWKAVQSCADLYRAEHRQTETPLSRMRRMWPNICNDKTESDDYGLLIHSPALYTKVWRDLFRAIMDSSFHPRTNIPKPT